MLDSRLVFLRKKAGNAPRPVRVGELWRRVIAKRLLHANREKIQRVCIAARQFGVAVPGGAEGLIHFRTLERRLAAGADATAVIDVDFQNAFPSLEWDSIREAVDEFLPEVGAWTAWCHAEPGRVVLPSGGFFMSTEAPSREIHWAQSTARLFWLRLPRARAPSSRRKTSRFSTPGTWTMASFRVAPRTLRTFCARWTAKPRVLAPPAP